MSLVEGPECHDNVVRVCRHGPRKAIMRVTRDDPFARPCYDSGLSSIENTTCPQNNFTLYIGLDPLFDEVGLYLK